MSFGPKKVVDERDPKRCGPNCTNASASSHSIIFGRVKVKVAIERSSEDMEPTLL
jgi:hypothetical protein